jgi:sirohydrochlorin ferrochelatase
VLVAVRAQLLHEPNVETRNRKRMDPDKRLYVAPWELRVGRLRVYYAVEAEAGSVVVLKVGIKDRDRVLIGGEPFKL